MAFEREIIYRIQDAALKKHRAELNGFFEQSAEKLRGLIGSMSTFGKVVATVGIGTLVVGLAAFAKAVQVGFRQAKEFEDAMLGVRKTTGLAGPALEDLRGRLVGLSKELGIGAAQLATYAEVAGQLGIRGNEAIAAFTETSAKLAAVSDLTAEDAANSVAKISLAYGVAIEQSERVGSVLNDLSNTTAATAGELADALRRVGTAGSSIGFTVDQVAALTATLISNGIEARIAGTSLRNAFILMQTEAGKFADQLGVTEQAFKDLLADDAQAALQTYLETLKDLDAQTRAIQIEEIFGRENFLAISTLSESLDQLAVNSDSAGRAFEENTSLAEEFATSLDSFGGQLGVARERLAALTMAVGEPFLNAATGALRIVNDLTASLKGLAQNLEGFQRTGADLRATLNGIKEFDDLKLEPDLGLDEIRRLNELTDEFQQSFPAFIVGLDASGRATDFYTDALRRNIEAQIKVNNLRQAETAAKIVDNFKKTAAEIDENTKRLAFLREEYKRLYSLFEGDEVGQGFVAAIESEIQDANAAMIDAQLEFSNTEVAILQLYDTAQGFDTQQLREDLLRAGRSLAEVDETVAKLEQRFLQLKLAATFAGESVSFFGGAETEGAGKPPPKPLTEEELERQQAAAEKLREEAERLRDVYEETERVVVRYAAMRTAMSEQEQDDLRALYDVQDDIREIEEQREAQVERFGEASATAFDERLEQLRTEEQAYSERLRSVRQAAQDLVVPMERIGQLVSELDASDTVPGQAAIIQLGRATAAQKQYLSVVKEIDTAVALGEITEEEAQRRRELAAKEFRQQLQQVYDRLAELGLLSPAVKEALAEVFKSLGDGADDSDKKLKKLIDATRLVATSVRGVLRLADAFGDVSDNARQAIEGIADVAEGISRIASGDVVGGAIQGVTGLIGALGGLFGDDDEARRARREAEEAAARLRESIRDNIRALDRATEAFLLQSQIGADVSQGEADAIESAFAYLEYLLTRTQTVQGPGGETTEPVVITETEARSYLDAMEQALLDAGIDIGADLTDLFDELLQSGLTARQALDRILSGTSDFDGLRSVILELLDSIGSYAGTVEGQIERIRDAQRYAGLAGEDALDAFLQGLLDNVDELSSDAQAYINELLALDRSDFDSQEDYENEIQRIVALLNEMGLATGLSTNELEALLDALLSFGSGVEGAGATVRDFANDIVRGADPDAIREAIQYLRDALRFGALDVEDALQILLDAIRDAGPGFEGDRLDAQQQALLDSFLDQIEGLQLNTQGGQDALADIIAQLFLLGADAFGLDEATFLAMLAELQNLGGQFGLLTEGITRDLSAGGDEDESNAFRVSRTITEFQANEILAVLRAILYAITNIDVASPAQPAPVDPVVVRVGASAPRLNEPPRAPVVVRTPPIIAPPRPDAPSLPSRSREKDAPRSSGGWVTVQLRQGDVDDLTRAVYPGVVRRMGADLRRTTKR